MSSVDVFATTKIQRKHYMSCVTHLCTNWTISFIQRLIGYMRRRCEAVVAARGGHTHYWTPQTSILNDNFCLSMTCSYNDVEKLCCYCFICYTHMNLNYTSFVIFFCLCKILSIKPLCHFFCWSILTNIVIIFDIIHLHVMMRFVLFCILIWKWKYLRQRKTKETEKI